MLSQLDNVNIAIASLTQEIAAAPTPELYLRRCKAYATLKQMPEAFADCRKAIELDGMHAGAHNYLAGLLIQEGKYEEAEQEAATANMLDPEEEGVFLLVAYEGHRLSKKIAAQPTAALYNKRGVLSMQQGALAPARADLEQAIQLDSKLAVAYTNLIDVLLKQALPLEAEKVLDTISDADAYYQNDKTLLIKKWCLLERKAQLAPHEKTYQELIGLATVQESVPTLQKAQEYRSLSQQEAAPEDTPVANATPAALVEGAAAPEMLSRLAAAPAAAPPAPTRRTKIDY